MTDNLEGKENIMFRKGVAKKAPNDQITLLDIKNENPTDGVQHFSKRCNVLTVKAKVVDVRAPNSLYRDRQLRSQVWLAVKSYDEPPSDGQIWRDYERLKTNK